MADESGGPGGRAIGRPIVRATARAPGHTPPRHQTLIEDLQGASAETAAGADGKSKIGKGTSQTKAATKATQGEVTRVKSIQRKPTERGSNEFAPRLAACQAAASRLPAHWRKLAGVDQATSACVDGTWPGPLEFDLMSVPLLTGVKPVTPFATVDELLDAVAHATENLESAVELERIFDGISRFGLQDSAAFRRRAAPLLVRRKKVRGKSWSTVIPFDLLIGTLSARGPLARGLGQRNR